MDKNGNVRQFIRSGRADDSLRQTAPFYMDIFETQVRKGNQLVYIHDGGTDQSLPDMMEFKNRWESNPEYTYDANGNMITDKNKGIRNIEYNCLNLPQKIDFSNGDCLRYLYDAGGSKRRMEFTSPTEGDLKKDYSGNRIYVSNQLVMLRTEGGYLSKENGSWTNYYCIRDHLGSNRVILNSTGSVYQTDNYYPFGLTMAENGLSRNDENHYWMDKFTGKELNRLGKINVYDFEARVYDPALGRFMTMDPLAEKYYWISPYAYCGNNPINKIDPDGRDIFFIVSVGGKMQNLKYTTQGTLQDSKGRTVNVPTDSHVGQILDGYNKMLNSGDASYVKQVTTLVKSDNVHEIDTRVKSSSGGSVVPGSKSETINAAKAKAIKGEGIGTTTKYNFSEKTLNNGLEKSNYTTVAHEVQHQYDFDQGKMKDHYDEKGERIEGSKNPAETRAIYNEDKARVQEKFDKRRNY